MSAVVERALLIVGLACCGWYGLAATEAAYTQRETREAVERALEAAAPRMVSDRIEASTPAGGATGGSLVGLLEIPRLGLSTPVVEGDDAGALRGAAGHLPDTPQPWEPGNSAIAAHRDGIFRPLRDIRVGDELRVETPRGELRYTVRDTHVVAPTDLTVLAPKSPQMLTLITCYPFNYIGPAPKRFVVHAERVE